MAPKTVNALQIQPYNEPYHVSEVMVLRLKLLNFCHIDLMSHNNAFNIPLPFIGAHKLAGIIEELGAGLKGSEVGDRGYRAATVDAKQSALDIVACYVHCPNALILATDKVEEPLAKIDDVISSNYRGVGATVLATDNPTIELGASLVRKNGTMVLPG
ncbi:hypothetical protein PISL3812_06119 [Talaromyces islandicus]|uniref:Alcohol dehydrogenase-like N-terminal domain-containing protein n=1 Tax=Talaromyces islandicus TaxID=28573 RepID=A0A0U1M0L0_TALIS|nr:hypothetical protein PISL3812_06119 [Talaromyces islandicus]